MRLSKFTDYAFRALIYLAKNENRLCTISELSENLQVSEHHMRKIVHQLSKKNFIDSLKGREGGIRLALNPSDTNLGDVVRETENLNLVECFKSKDSCPYSCDNCMLKKIAKNSLNSFISEFSMYSLQDIV